MAREKKEEPPKGSPAWMSTFSDLMNLLLCFFVMLFAMSSPDQAKFDQLAQSFAQSFSIFSAGGSAIGEGQLIASGVKQLNNLGEYFSNLGEASQTDEESDNDPTKKYEQERAEKQKKKTTATYSEVAEQANQAKIADYIDINMDADYKFVRISIKGGLLFESGKADIRQESIPILNKLGDILKNYSECRISIEGHTDNVPISKNILYKSNMELSSARAISVWDYFTLVKKLDPNTLEATGRGEYDPIADNNTEEGRAKNRRVEFKIHTDIE